MIKTARYFMTESEYHAVKRLMEGTVNPKIRRRLRVLTLRYEGKRDKEIASLCGLHQASISTMWLRYRRQGLAEYARNKYTSHCRLLSEAQEKAILSEFADRALAGHAVSASEIKLEFDKACGKDTGNV